MHDIRRNYAVNNIIDFKVALTTNPNKRHVHKFKLFKNAVEGT